MGEFRQNIAGEITTLNIITGTHTYEKKRNRPSYRRQGVFLHFRGIRSLLLKARSIKYMNIELALDIFLFQPFLS
jgi:hypothetical protein